MHTHIHTYNARLWHIYIHTVYIHTVYMHTVYIHTVHIHTYIHSRLAAYLQMLTKSNTFSTYIHTYIHTFVLGNIPPNADEI
jgi:hypothetical protein